MEPTKTGIRELKAKLSEYLRTVKKGETVVVTEHGKPIGRIIPYDLPIEEKLQLLKESSIVSWSGNKPSGRRPSVKTEKGTSISDLIVEERESR